MVARGLQEIHVALPRALVQEAEASGLLDPAEMESLLRDALRKRRVARLFEAAERLADLPGEALTAEEVAAEVEQARRARHRLDAGGR